MEFQPLAGAKIAALTLLNLPLLTLSILNLKLVDKMENLSQFMSLTFQMVPPWKGLLLAMHLAT